MRDVRVCVFGDSLVVGVGDPKALGWVGRVAARTPRSTGVDLTVYPLGVRGESTEEIVVRMPVESAARFARGDDHRVVLAAGVADAHHAIPPARSAAALEFGVASASVPVMVVGPPPVGDADMRQRIAAIDEAYAAACGRLRVPYLPTYSPLVNRKPWHDARAEDGMHPNQTGYGLLAYVVLNGGWYDWLGLSPPASPTRQKRGATN